MLRYSEYTPPDCEPQELRSGGCYYYIVNMSLHLSLNFFSAVICDYERFPSCITEHTTYLTALMPMERFVITFSLPSDCFVPGPHLFFLKNTDNEHMVHRLYGSKRCIARQATLFGAYGISSSRPVTRRCSNAACALAASASGYIRSILMERRPSFIHSRNCGMY